ncbi:hypothetical protein QBC43DRAFT_337220 [Cladorrhinum sp. PSN259]|nr:hypothetical protein QBC43DRAFT_337220 [Cladorrhinum sp. PSN259]
MQQDQNAAILVGSLVGWQLAHVLGLSRWDPTWLKMGDPTHAPDPEYRASGSEGWELIAKECNAAAVAAAIKLPSCQHAYKINKVATTMTAGGFGAFSRNPPINEMDGRELASASGFDEDFTAARRAGVGPTFSIHSACILATAVPADFRFEQMLEIGHRSHPRARAENEDAHGIRAGEFGGETRIKMKIAYNIHSIGILCTPNDAVLNPFAKFTSNYTLYI